MSKGRAVRAAAAISAAVAVIVLAGCASTTSSGSTSPGNSPSPSNMAAGNSGNANAGSAGNSNGVLVSGTPDSTDQMFGRDEDAAEFYTFQYGGDSLTVDNGYEVDLRSDLEDGKFYKVIADVRYLNGGVAGYVDYPEIKDVISIEEVSPFELNLPAIEDQRYGLTLVGDYADGDVFYYGSGTMALWKDGKWTCKYGQSKELDDTRIVCLRKGVKLEDVQARIDAGTISCEDFFVLPPKPAK